MARVRAGSIIGVDFDNTIVSYDLVIRSVAIGRGLIGPDGPRNKRAIRDAIRRLPDGEIAWQKVQAEVYGPRMQEAELIEGVASFFARCRRDGIEVHIVSHKTEFARFDATGTNLRRAALDWLRAKRALAPDGLGLDPGRIWFTATRGEKVVRIAALKCSYFVDDLIEVFTEPDFPFHVHKLLFAPAGNQGRGTVSMFANWSEIEAYLFNDP